MDEIDPPLRTVGQFYNYILECRRQTQQQGCPTARTFRDVRRVLTETASVPRQRTMAAVPIEEQDFDCEILEAKEK